LDDIYESVQRACDLGDCGRGSHQVTAANKLARATLRVV
jgi:hypothetical protein